MTAEDKQRIEQAASKHIDLLFESGFLVSQRNYDPFKAGAEWAMSQPKPETFTREEVEKLLEWMGEHEISAFCENHELPIVLWEDGAGKPMGTTSQLIDKFKTK